MSNRINRLARVAAALSIAFSTSALAASNGSALVEAQQLLASGQPAQACALLGSEVNGAATGAEALTLLGLCNEQLGDWGKAISYYERALRIVPDASLVRARLAALYLLEGRTSDAEAELGMAISTALLSENVDQSRVASASGATARVALSRVFDSNINAGSSATTMTGLVFGVPLPMVIDPSSRAIGDSGTSLSLQARQLTPLGPNHALLTSLNLAATIYDQMSQYDRQSVGVAAALLYGDAAVNALVQPSLQASFEGGELDTIRAGVSAMAQRELSDRLSVFAAGELAYRHNGEEAERSAWDRRVALGLRYALNENFEVGVSYGVRSTISGRPTESYFAQGPEISLDAQLAENVSLGLSYGYEFATYDERSALFPVDREEDRHVLAAQIDVDLSKHLVDGLGLVARYEYSMTDSSLPLYDNERHAASIGLTYSF